MNTTEWTPEELGAEIARRRTERGMSQSELAHQFGVERTQVSRWENGKHVARGKHRAQLVAELELEDEWFDEADRGPTKYRLEKRVANLERGLTYLALMGQAPTRPDADPALLEGLDAVIERLEAFETTRARREDQLRELAQTVDDLRQQVRDLARQIPQQRTQ